MMIVGGRWSGIEDESKWALILHKSGTGGPVLYLWTEINASYGYSGTDTSTITTRNIWQALTGSLFLLSFLKKGLISMARSFRETTRYQARSRLVGTSTIYRAAVERGGGGRMKLKMKGGAVGQTVLATIQRTRRQHSQLDGCLMIQS